MIPNKELYQNKGLLKSFFSLGRLAIPRKKAKTNAVKKEEVLLKEDGCPSCGVKELTFTKEGKCPFCNTTY
jgi:RNA polymerase subunit RPABC4/transcription elongation factor Spt4